ncbi:phosphoprotein phosphatase [Tritrichomonas foetus]|uniref:Phosphoprotein phosphatase n=1 Tax=Tritrichomonas foetus TaxID=1144522 RepID=A0A1J4KAY2_9EUKA|nr:phosphoprotein phosphatase [Tritrichomonas foetus]|eukprot:OHT08583.1 phosphoprotein phosphatase [Tritrichomonas foetus]
MRVSQRNSLVLNPSRKSTPNNSVNKKASLKPIAPKPNSQDIDTEKQPISDFPSPPVQIVSCRHGQPDEMIPLPQISTAPHGEIPQLALQKIKQCCRICDFSDKQADAGSKITKTQTLNEIIDCYTNQKLFSRLTRDCHQALIEMFAANVFRPPPSIPRAIMISDDVIIEDTAWPHLNLVYILFLKFLESKVDLRILQFKLDPKFITSLYAILDFPDERERCQAKAVIAAIYNEVPPQRKILSNICLNLLLSVPEGLEMNAASHLLDLFYLFTTSTLPPLPPMLITTFKKVLLPLHLSERCQRYFQPLVKCILQMIRKDNTLGNTLLKFLIAHWPLTLDHKSELFIDEITQMLNDGNYKNIDDNIDPLLRCVSIAAESPCTTLADKALKFMLNNSILNAVSNNPDHLLEIIFPPLFRVARSHWQRNLQLCALNVMNALVDLVPENFKKAAVNFKQTVISEAHRKVLKRNFWDMVAKVAVSNYSTIDTDYVNKELSDFFGDNRRRNYHINSDTSSPTISLNTRSSGFHGKLLVRSSPNVRAGQNSSFYSKQIDGVPEDDGIEEEIHEEEEEEGMLKEEEDDSEIVSAINTSNVKKFSEEGYCMAPNSPLIADIQENNNDYTEYQSPHLVLQQQEDAFSPNFPQPNYNFSAIKKEDEDTFSENLLKPKSLDITNDNSSSNFGTPSEMGIMPIIEE